MSSHLNTSRFLSWLFFVCPFIFCNKSLPEIYTQKNSFSLLNSVQESTWVWVHLSPWSGAWHGQVTCILYGTAYWNTFMRTAGCMRFFIFRNFHTLSGVRVIIASRATFESLMSHCYPMQHTEHVTLWSWRQNMSLTLFRVNFTRSETCPVNAHAWVQESVKVPIPACSLDTWSVAWNDVPLTLRHLSHAWLLECKDTQLSNLCLLVLLPGWRSSANYSSW